MRTQFKPVLISFMLLAMLTGVIYPLTVTGLAQLIFPQQANGSLININGKVQGSALIGQPFDDPRYFWGRLSATAPYPYNASASAGSNLGPSNPALLTVIKARITALEAADPQNTSPIPIDLVTASGSGLDPHISLVTAFYQVPRVAKARGVSVDVAHTLVDQYAENPQLGFLGEVRVNVLELNLALDGIK
jgi:potassium-transporting ATPase KdpC subunit